MQRANDHTNGHDLSAVIWEPVEEWWIVPHGVSWEDDRIRRQAIARRLLDGQDDEDD